MLAGQLPYKGRTPLHTLFMRAERDADPIESLRDDCPPLLSRIVHGALARDPEKRYQSAGEMLEHLKLLDKYLREHHSLLRSQEGKAQAAEKKAVPGSTKKKPPRAAVRQQRREMQATTVVLPESYLSARMLSLTIDAVVIASFLVAWNIVADRIWG
jgi:serine/threonine protein kinase